MAVTRSFSQNRWTRDAAYRADYVLDLVELIAEEVQTLGWSVAPGSKWQGEIDRTAEARLEQFVNDDQIRMSIEPKARTIRIWHLDASASEETWSFVAPLAKTPSELGAMIRTHCA